MFPDKPLRPKLALDDAKLAPFRRRSLRLFFRFPFPIRETALAKWKWYFGFVGKDIRGSRLRYADMSRWPTTAW